MKTWFYLKNHLKNIIFGVMIKRAWLNFILCLESLHFPITLRSFFGPFLKRMTFQESLVLSGNDFFSDSIMDVKHTLRFIFFTFLFLPMASLAWCQIEGRVIDENQVGMPGTNVLLLPDSLVKITDLEGSFSFENLSDATYELRVFFIGYITDSLFVEVQDGQSETLIINLQPSNTLLHTVQVTEEHAKQEATLRAEHIHEDFFQKNLEGSFAKTIEKLPGISSINVGVGIAKPVIRGLSSNRIIVNHQGVKQESQQWGSDHGLEIDQFDVESVEIIKGPGSLQYGSDGLGGVINIMPDKLLPENSFAGSVIGVYKTNNDHWGGSAKLGVNKENWFLTARYSRQDFADYRVPGNTFLYNGFELPIVNEQLKNTAGDESNFSISAGVSKPWGITRLLFSHYSLDAGLFSGAVGIPRSYALTDDGNPRDLDVPKQAVDHYRVSLNQTFFFGNNHLAIDLGLQRNLRQEFSVPEFHSIPLSQLENPNDNLALELLLETFSIASHFEHRFRSNWKNIYGVNFQIQHNRRGGFEYLLPDFQTIRTGVYTILENEIRENWVLNGGVRFDIAQNDTEFYDNLFGTATRTSSIPLFLLPPRTCSSIGQLQLEAALP